MINLHLIISLALPMNVLLVRNPSEDTPDRYHQHLESIGLHPHSVPVLETVYTNLGNLHDIVTGNRSDHGGVIMTSSRSAEAWDLVREGLSSVQWGDLHSPGEQCYVVVWVRPGLLI